MHPGDIPLSGDWMGTGKAQPGYFRPAEGAWHLRNSSAISDRDLLVVQIGKAGDTPLVGDWDADGKDTPGIYRSSSGEVLLWNDWKGGSPQVSFTVAPNLNVVAAPWYGHIASDANKRDTLAVVEINEWSIEPLNCNCTLSNLPKKLVFPVDAGMPVAGVWAP
jgi:hypothetical protein